MWKRILKVSFALLLFFSAVMGAKSFPAVGPSVYVAPQSITVYEGNTFDVSVKIFNLTNISIQDPKNPDFWIPLGNLYGFDHEFHWDPAAFGYVTHTVTVPVEDYPEGVLYYPVFEMPVTNLDEVAGIYRLAYSSYFPAASFNNPDLSNSTFTMTLTAKKAGTFTLSLVNVELSTKEGKKIGVDVEGYPTFLHVFSGSVKVKMRGDVDGNNRVDGSDFYEVARAYGSALGSSNWNPECDFNKDNKVDKSDLTDLSKNYGKRI